MARLALYTFGVLRDTFDSEKLKDVVAGAAAIYAQLAAADGFIAQARDARPELCGDIGLGEDFGPWGPYSTPRFYDEALRASGFCISQSLTLWQDRPSAYQFSYRGQHQVMLKRRNEWFRRPGWPSYVLWFIDDDAIPTWSEGAERLEKLFDLGATAEAFTFIEPYDECGQRAGVVLPFDQPVAHRHAAAA